MERKLSENRIWERMEAPLALALLLLGFMTRLALIGSLPYGLNQDEASIGYDAWALLNYGVDRCGSFLPVLLKSWGSGQNALQAYLSMPFIALFGLDELTVRIVPALSGCAALFIMWRLARRVRGRAFGLTALFFLAICPWHIMASRWALESNLLPTLLLCGIYFTVCSRERPWSLLPAAACFGLSLYAYGTAYFFLPPFLIFAVIWLRKSIRPASFLLSLAAFILIALPISLCQMRNALGLPETTLFGLTLPALTETRQAATSVLGGGGLEAVGENLKSLARLLISQSDGLPFNSLGLSSGGLFYAFGLPLALIGAAASLWESRHVPGEAAMRAAVCCSILAAAFIDVNINRVNMLWLPLCYFAALGLYKLLCLLGRWNPVLLSVVYTCFILFSCNYVNHFSGMGDSSYFPGLGECIRYVEAEEPESGFVSHYVNQPYILTLFYTETPPEEFIDTVDYVNPDGAFRWVSSFGHWRFGDAQDAEGEYLILHVSEAGERERLFERGQFVVCRG